MLTIVIVMKRCLVKNFKYNLIYIKRVDLVQINKELNKSLQEVQDQKESFEKRKCEPMA